MKTFVKSTVNRLFTIEDRPLGSNLNGKTIEKSPKNLKILKSMFSQIERQALEKNNIINLLIINYVHNILLFLVL